MDDEVLTDELWARLEPLIPLRPRRFKNPGRLRMSDRAAYERILWVPGRGRMSLSGASGAMCWRRLARWQEAGLWQQLHEVLLGELRAAEKLDLSAAIVHSSHLRALKGGNQVGPSPVDRSRRQP